ARLPSGDQHSARAGRRALLLLGAGLQDGPDVLTGRGAWTISLDDFSHPGQTIVQPEARKSSENRTSLADLADLADSCATRPPERSPRRKRAPKEARGASGGVLLQESAKSAKSAKGRYFPRENRGLPLDDSPASTRKSSTGMGQMPAAVVPAGRSPSSRAT